MSTSHSQQETPAGDGLGPAPAPRRAALVPMARCVAALIVFGSRLLTGVRALWASPAQAAPTIYFANHTSHGDFVLLWSSLPPALRQRTRPVAAADYWRASGFRRFIGESVFNALLIARTASGSAGNPVAQMAEALSAGQSLILFPEGTRNTGEEALLPFKSGLFHLAEAQPCARLVPVWIQNLRRVLPKGMLVPLPLACSVHFGEALVRLEDEPKTEFLARARHALLALQPPQDDEPGDEHDEE